MQKQVKTYCDIDKIWGECSRIKHLLSFWWNKEASVDHHAHPWGAVSGPSVPPWGHIPSLVIIPAWSTLWWSFCHQVKKITEEGWNLSHWSLDFVLPCFKVVGLSTLSETQESVLNIQAVFPVLLYNNVINLLLVISSYASRRSWCHMINTNAFLPVLQSSPVCCPRTWYPKTTSCSDMWSPSPPPLGSASTIWKAASESRLMRMQKWQTRSCTWKDCGRWSATRASVCDGQRRHTSAQDAGWLELCGHVKKKTEKEISHWWNSF